MIIVETERQNLRSMKDVDHLNYSINQHMKKIKEHLEGEKIMQLFQMVAEYSVKHAGMSYMNNRTMAKKLGVHVRTIQRYTKKLEQLQILLKIPTTRKKNRGQTSNTYVILPVIKSVVSRVCHGVCHPLNPSLKPLKQESNNYISNLQEDKIVQYIVNKVNDSIKKGTKIKYLSSYIDRTVRSLEWQSLYSEAMRQDAIRKQREEEQSKKMKELLGMKESATYQPKIDFDLFKKIITSEI